MWNTQYQQGYWCFSTPTHQPHPTPPLKLMLLLFMIVLIIIYISISIKRYSVCVYKNGFLNYQLTSEAQKFEYMYNKVGWILKKLHFLKIFYMGLKCRTGFLKSRRFSRHLYRAIILVQILFFWYGHYGHFGQKCRLCPWWPYWKNNIFTKIIARYRCLEKRLNSKNPVLHFTVWHNLNHNVILNTNPITQC